MGHAIKDRGRSSVGYNFSYGFIDDSVLCADFIFNGGSFFDTSFRVVCKSGIRMT